MTAPKDRGKPPPFFDPANARLQQIRVEAMLRDGEMTPEDLVEQIEQRAASVKDRDVVPGRDADLPPIPDRAKAYLAKARGLEKPK